MLLFFKRFASPELARSIDAGGHAGAPSQKPAAASYAFWNCESILAPTRPPRLPAADWSDDLDAAALAVAATPTPATTPQARPSGDNGISIAVATAVSVEIEVPTAEPSSLQSAISRRSAITLPARTDFQLATRLAITAAMNKPKAKACCCKKLPATKKKVVRRHVRLARPSADPAPATTAIPSLETPGSFQRLVHLAA